MKGIVIFAFNGSVVFHTAPFSRDVVDSVVHVVESDIEVKASFETYASPNGDSSTSTPQQMGESVFTLREASAKCHGGIQLKHSARWLETNHERIADGHIAVFPSEHPWLKDADDSGAVVYWRKVGDRVFVFVLDSDENISLAHSAVSNLILLLADAFTCRSGEMPSLKDLLVRSELVDECCRCIAPQNILALVDIQAARTCLYRQLNRK
jgi:hypothetical protein